MPVAFCNQNATIPGMSGKRLTAAFSLSFWFFASFLSGQGTTSRLTGVVEDPSGAAVSGVTVRLTNEGTLAAFSATTADNGVYFFDSIQSGTYSVAVEAPGFKKFVSRGNTVAIGQPATVNIKLEVGDLAQQVEVSGTAELVQTSTSGNIGNLFVDRVIKDLPIVGTRGRNPLDLVTRQPGVVGGANTGGGFHVHGARDRAWNFTLDGIDVNETSAGGSNFSPLRTNPDSLSEFRVLTGNFTADTGRNSGGQVAMVTKSGTNEFHGTGFWFYRTPRLNANEWEFNINNLGKRQFVQNIWGGSFGGPIHKNKLFFFGNLQQLRARESAVVDRTVYTQTARQGIYRYVLGGRNIPFQSPGASVDRAGNPVAGVSLGSYNIVTSDPERLGLDPRIKALTDAAPLPNNFAGGDGLNTALFTFAALQFEKQYDATVKVDYILNSKNTAYARIAWGQQDTNCDRANGGSPVFPGAQCLVDTKRNPRNYAFNWRTVPSSTMTNEMVFGRNFFAFDFVNPTSDLTKTTLIAPVAIAESFDVGNKRSLTTWQFVDNFSWLKGPHALKFGTNVRIGQHVDTRGSIGGANSTTNVNFSRLVNTVGPAFGVPSDINTAFDLPNLQTHINYLLGRVGAISRGFISEGDAFVPGVYDFDARFPEYDFYAMDTWKARKNLTIDLGLRLEWKLTPSSSPDGRVRRPNQAVAAGGLPSSVLKWEAGSLYRSDKNNWAPSIGFAWDPFSSGKTSIRGNYRLAYDRINTFLLSSAVFQNLPGQVQGLTNQDFGTAGGRLRNVPLLNPPTLKPSALAQPPSFSVNNITVVDPNFETPTTHGWSFGIQRQIGKSTVIEAMYIGRRAHNLFGAYNANQVDVTRNGFAETFRAAQAGNATPLLDRLMTPLRTGTETSIQTMQRLYRTELSTGAAGTVANDLARRTISGRTLTETAGLGSFFFMPYPQFAGGMNVVDSNDYSTYHGLELQIERRLQNGMAFQLSYTWSKSLDTRSYDPAFTVVSGANNQSASSTPFDIYNRNLNYAPSDFDRTHAIQSYWVYELPFGKGRRLLGGAGPWTDRLIGGWQFAGFATIQGGRPFTVYSGFNTFSQVLQSTANCNGCLRADGDVFDGPGGVKWYLDPANNSRFSTPAAGNLGNLPRNFFRGPGSFSMDASLSKWTNITERVKMQIRMDATNLTNTPTFGFPTATVSSTIFGRIRDTVISASRKMQLGAKIEF